MKKSIIPVILSILLPHAVYADYCPIDSFSLSSTVYNIYCETDGSKSTDYVVEVDAAEYGEMAFIVLSSKDLTTLFRVLNVAKQTYDKWCMTAISNNVSLLYRKIPQSVYYYSVEFTSAGQLFCDRASFHTGFFVDRDGGCHLILESDKLKVKEKVSTATTYRSRSLVPILGHGGIGLAFVPGRTKASTVIQHSSDGVQLVFSSDAEIEAFIAALQRAEEWKKRNVEQYRLF